MKTKVIATFLIYCFLFQMPFINTGCTSFYPVEGDNNIADYMDYEGDLLLKLNDGTEIEVPEHGIFYIEQDQIDSGKIVEYYSDFYQQYWTKDNKKLAFNLGKSPAINSDTTGNFYFVLEADGAFRQIYNNDIVEIQIQKPDYDETSWLVIGVICMTIAGIIILMSNSMHHMFDGPWQTAGGKGGL